MKSELIEFAKKKCIEYDVVIELYEEPIDYSEYHPETSVLQLCTVSKEGIPDEAVVYHEIAHAEQHHEKYWALMLILWMDKWIGYYPSVLHYIVERNATNMALWAIANDNIESYASCETYLYKQLEKYRRNLNN